MADPQAAMIPDALAQTLRTVDEAVLISLANRGVLKRAQRAMENGGVSALAISGDGVTARVEAYTVTLPASGPGDAACTCPAPGMCSHILTVTLAAKAAVATAPASAAAAGQARSVPDAALMEREIVAFSDEDLLAWAGKGAWRQAVRMLEDFPQVATDAGTTLQIHLPSPALTVHYRLGGGLHGMMSKVAPAKLKAVHLAALLAVRRAAGLSILLPGSDAEPLRSLSDQDRELVQEAAQWVRGLVQVGLAHLSLEQVEQGLDLALSAQADRLPRLSREVAGLAEECGRLIDRQASATDTALLRRAARVWALCQALLAAPPAGLEPLVGKSRARYHPVDRLLLVPLGYYPWLAPSGMAGVTFLFHAPSQRLSYSCAILSVAQGNAGGMDAAQFLAKAHGGLLAGLGQVDALAGHQRVQLIDGKISEDRRISLAGQARLSPAGLAEPTDLDAITHGDWDALADLAGRVRPVGLQAPGPLAALAVIQPAALGDMSANLADQRAEGIAMDAQGRCLALRVVHGPGSRWRTTGLLALGGQWQPGDRIVGFVRSGGSLGLGFDPIALLPTDPARSALSLDAMGRTPALARLSAGASDLADLALSQGDTPLEEPQPTDALGSLLATGSAALVRLAVGGSLVAQPGVGGTLGRVAQEADRMGLATMANALGAVTETRRPEPDRLLQAAWVIALAEGLAG